jgi:adenine-specific DNA-methyltransferase
LAAPIEKLKSLLRELFQFDCADLDFGIYRIMNYKRDAIEKFITGDLPKCVEDELGRGELADQSKANAELKKKAAQIQQTLAADALDAEGKLAEAYYNTLLGKQYLDLQERASGGRSREALEAGIFNHLYSFFRRYYQDGDFISKRRYSKRQKYAIPYNGEQNNVKGDKRFFLPLANDIDWREDSDELFIPFEYRLLTEREQVAYGTKNQQDKIIAAALAEIPGRLKPKAGGALGYAEYGIQSARQGRCQLRELYGQSCTWRDGSDRCRPKTHRRRQSDLSTGNRRFTQRSLLPPPVSTLAGRARRQDSQ